jgi:hypothetical protein
MTTGEFIALWSRWDEYPSHKAPANDFEDACQEMARIIGTTATQLRIELSHLRSQRFTRAHALQEAIDALVR